MIVAVVPAAGRSARMGRPKLLMDFQGETLIHRVVAALHDGGAERVVVVPPVDLPESPLIAAEASDAGAEVVIPEIQPAEMRDSVELGLAVLDADPRPTSVLLTPGDVPGISAGLVKRLVDAANDHPDRIVIPTHDGHHGHPIVLPWAIAVGLRDLPDDAGVNRLVDDHRDRVIEIAVTAAGEIDDMDTPEDMEAFVGRVRPTHGGGASPPESGIESASPTFTLRIRLFAIAQERAGESAVEVELADPATVGDVREALRSGFPRLDTLAHGSMISVDEEYASDDTPVTAASRVALIPPVSGGAIGTDSGVVAGDD